MWWGVCVAGGSRVLCGAEAGVHVYSGILCGGRAPCVSLCLWGADGWGSGGRLHIVGCMCGEQSSGSQKIAVTSPCPHRAPFSPGAVSDGMAQALASPGLFSDDDVAASPVLESTARGFGADVRKDLLSEFSAISPNLEGPQQVRLELFCHEQGNVLSCGCYVCAQKCCDARDSSEEVGTKCSIGESTSF